MYVCVRVTATSYLLQRAPLSGSFPFKSKAKFRGYWLVGVQVGCV
jgi:hypothetical protein